MEILTVPVFDYWELLDELDENGILPKEKTENSGEYQLLSLLFGEDWMFDAYLPFVFSMEFPEIPFHLSLSKKQQERLIDGQRVCSYLREKTPRDYNKVFIKT